jgi:hypothetical protein
MSRAIFEDKCAHTRLVVGDRNFRRITVPFCIVAQKRLANKSSHTRGDARCRASFHFGCLWISGASRNALTDCLGLACAQAGCVARSQALQRQCSTSTEFNDDGRKEAKKHAGTKAFHCMSAEGCARGTQILFLSTGACPNRPKQVDSSIVIKKAAVGARRCRSRVVHAVRPTPRLRTSARLAPDDSGF